jgi:hypothetical protein
MNALEVQIQQICEKHGKKHVLDKFKAAKPTSNFSTLESFMSAWDRI